MSLYLSNSMKWCLRENHWLVLLAQYFNRCVSARCVFMFISFFRSISILFFFFVYCLIALVDAWKGAVAFIKEFWFMWKLKSECLVVRRLLMFCLSACLDRRLLCGLPGPHTQRRPLRSQKDVCQQRPGPECLQEGDHHHGENSDALSQASSLTSCCLNVFASPRPPQWACSLKDSSANRLTIRGPALSTFRSNNIVDRISCLQLNPQAMRSLSVL